MCFVRCLRGFVDLLDLGGMLVAEVLEGISHAIGRNLEMHVFDVCKVGMLRGREFFWQRGAQHAAILEREIAKIEQS